MLVLTRKAGERIMIGDDIEVVVLQSQGGRVRLGLIAPDEVLIRRGEFKDRIKRRRQSPLHNRPRPATVSKTA